jgi:hypothetical protein
MLSCHLLFFYLLGYPAPYHLPGFPPRPHFLVIHRVSTSYFPARVLSSAIRARSDILFLVFHLSTISLVTHSDIGCHFSSYLRGYQILCGSPVYYCFVLLLRYYALYPGYFVYFGICLSALYLATLFITGFACQLFTILLFEFIEKGWCPTAVQGSPARLSYLI